MREKIAKLAKGQFVYDIPVLQFTPELLTFEAVIGKEYRGTFRIENSETHMMKGVLYCKDENMTLLNQTFVGTACDIEFSYHVPEAKKAGEKIDGEIIVVSNLKEESLFYEIIPQAPYLESSLGKVRDLLHFTNVAKADKVQAVKLFKNPEFMEILLNHNDALVYESLIQSTSTLHALEEFLVAVHKKLPVTLTVSKTSFYYSNVTENLKESILFTKDQWGYAGFRVTTDSEFLKPDHKYIWTDSFTGDHFNLEVIIDYTKLKPRQNIGHITVSNAQQAITIEIVAECPPLKRVNDDARSKCLEYEMLLTRRYLDFRLNKISKVDYEESLEAILQNLNALEPSTKYTLWQAHLFMLSGREKELALLMKSFDHQKNELLEESVDDYLGYLYLKALYSKKEEDIDFAITTIYEYYDKEYKYWGLLWYLFYLDKRYDENPLEKLLLIKEQFEQGVVSPVLYYEACLIYNDQPSLLKELGRFESHVVHFAVRNQCMSEQLADQFIFLAGREKHYQKLMFGDLTTLYEQYPQKHILTEICRLCISGNCTDAKYFKWYELGVKEQLKLTKLYESYMIAIPMEESVTIDHTVLLYFVYNNQLPDVRKAFLYSYIIRNKEQDASTYRTYYKQMESFAIKQLLKGNINQELSIVYQEMITGPLLTEELAKALCKILFCYEITCPNKKITGVYVNHKELMQEQYVPLLNGRALIHLYTQNYAIYLVDEDNNRYAKSVPYTLNRFINHLDVYNCLYELNYHDLYLALYLNDRIYQNRQKEKEAFHIHNRLIHHEAVSLVCKQSMYYEMIEHYYEEGVLEKLDQYLNTLDLSLIVAENRPKVIEYLIMRELYEKALVWINEYGYEGVADNRLLKFATEVIRGQWATEKVFMHLCHSLIQKGKFNDEILNYLIQSEENDTRSLYTLWELGQDRKLSTTLLEERLLGQMLFSENTNLDSLKVFKSYHLVGKNLELIKAFYNYYAYQYLVKESMPSDDLMRLMRHIVTMHDLPVCKLALLKFYSTIEETTEEDLKFIELTIYEFVKKGTVLPFFKKYSDKIDMPHNILDKYYVQYITNPKKKVMVHYFLENEEENSSYFTQEMKNVFEGIFVTDFILFYGETLNYYITEEDETEIITTESCLLEADQSLVTDNNRFSMINLCLVSRARQEDKTLIQLMKQCVENEYVASSIFKPL